MLTLTGSKRILAIKDKGGQGKTHLLLKFDHHCRTATSSRSPVCYIDFNDFPGEAIIPVIQSMAKQLQIFGVTFPTFQRLDDARRSRDFGPFRAYMDLQATNFTAATNVSIAGVMFNAPQVNALSVHQEVVEFTPQHESVAQEKSIQAFFDDLQMYVAQRPLVLLFDTYEKCTTRIREWLLNDLIEKFFFPFAPQLPALILVIAGQEIPAFNKRWPSEHCNRLVHSIGLSRLQRHHTEAFLQVRNVSPQDNELDVFQNYIERGVTLFALDTFISSIQRGIA